MNRRGNKQPSIFLSLHFGNKAKRGKNILRQFIPEQQQQKKNSDKYWECEIWGRYWTAAPFCTSKLRNPFFSDASSGIGRDLIRAINKQLGVGWEGIHLDELRQCSRIRRVFLFFGRFYWEILGKKGLGHGRRKEMRAWSRLSAR